MAGRCNDGPWSVHVVKGLAFSRIASCVDGAVQSDKPGEAHNCADYQQDKSKKKLWV